MVSIRNGLILASLLLAWVGVSPLRAQFVEVPTLSRGQVSFQMEPTAQLLNALHAESAGSRSLGHQLFPSGLGPDQLPELDLGSVRFRSLGGLADTSVGLNLGRIHGRVSADRQILPLGLSYGVLDRLAVGVTVPFVRSRVDVLLRHTPEGSTAGRNPAQASPAGVNAFLSQAAAAFDEVQAAVNDRCAALGSAHEDCLQGTELLAEAEAFLLGLTDAYQEERFFPLLGSPLGQAIDGRWAGLAQGFLEWGTEGPEAPPLAAGSIDDPAFRTLVLQPAWPGQGFPHATPPPTLALGDVEAHLAVALLDGVESAGGIRVRSSVMGTIRWGTGSPDTLRTIAPMNPPVGVGGVGVAWISDLLVNRRVAVLASAAAEWYGTRDLVLLAPDPDGIYSPGSTRARARWEPGSHVQVSVTPRFLLGDVLSFGGGWHLSRRGGDRFSALDPGGPSLPADPGSASVHRVAAELRYVVRSDAMAERTAFPLELLLRASRTISGTGDPAPADRRIEGGLRVLLRR